MSDVNTTAEAVERLVERLTADADAPDAARYQPYTDHAMRDAAAMLRALLAERDRLRAALQSVLGACDQGRLVERGAGGMTLEAQMRRSVYNHVPAWPIEEARAALKETGHEA